MEIKKFNFGHLALIELCILVLLPVCKGEIEPVLQKCCSIGSSWGTNHTTCTGPALPVPGISPEDRLTCHAAIYICCIRIHRHIQCEKGKQSARAGQACSLLQTPGGEAHEDCCKACGLGLRLASQKQQCVFHGFTFGSPWDEAFSECCQNAINEIPTYKNDSLCARSNDCSQLCKDVGNRVECSCFHGFLLMADQKNCEDLDECELGTHSCNLNLQTCQNAVGGFQCRNKDNNPSPNTRPGDCPPGFIKNPLRNTCDDIDECAQDVCPSHEICTNSIGSYSCLPRGNEQVCLAGFRKHPVTGRCIDIDECAEKIDSCDRNEEMCLNSHGNYHCQPKTTFGKDCPAGFKWDDQEDRCEDVDECVEKLDDCYSSDEECRNTIGGYECDPRCAEGQSYDEIHQKCSGVDHCIESKHKCQNDEECLSVDDGFRCIKKAVNLCPPGYKPIPAMDGTAPSCVDVDECEEFLGTCDPVLENCVNEIGSYGCIPKHKTSEQISCPTGFKYDLQRERCLDVNECEENVDICNQVTEVCVNTNGSYNCDKKLSTEECPPGYRLHPLWRTCEDINECEEKKNKCLNEKETCINLPGGYRCQPVDEIKCPRGYKHNATAKVCNDVNECAEDKHSCNLETQNCINAIGSYHCIAKVPTCPHGYRREGDNCEDVDECTEKLDDCDPAQYYCVNTIGSFQCHKKSPPTPRCGTGFSHDAVTGICSDINECEDDMHTCDRQTELCVNYDGSFNCVRLSSTTKSPLHTIPFSTASTFTYSPRTRITKRRFKYRTTSSTTIRGCKAGLKYDRTVRSCVDIDECEEIKPCASDQTCENAQGSYTCMCQQGYILNRYTKECGDVNECQYNLHSCTPTQRCDNTIGSYTCVRITGCGTGYTLNAHTSECEDDDECILGVHNCGIGFVCRNTQGSFRCDRAKCPIGQKLLQDGNCHVVACPIGLEPDANGNCADINECSNIHVCQKNQRCLNTVGSYRCQNLIHCSAGFEMDEYGTQCVDVDECTHQLDECGAQQICRNRPGGYTCECPVGYALNSERQCEDIDECTRFHGQVCSITSNCQNTQGSYVCDCKEGFKKAEDGRNCIDVDECNDIPNICQQTCINVWGSFQCSCQQGYTLAPDGRVCQDIDECNIWEGRGNLCIGNCINEPGSYSCSCPEGYRLNTDKRTCRDVDECQEQNVCRGENEVCLNTRGSFKCNIISCPTNYIRDHNHRNRCKRTNMDCLYGDTTCLDDPLSLSYNYLTFVSNMRIPLSGQLDLFTMRGPRFATTSVEISLELKSARAVEGVVAATRENFHIRRTAFNEAMVSLVKTIPGPQEIELELLMKIYHNGLFGGKAVAKIFIFVTRHEF